MKEFFLTPHLSLLPTPQIMLMIEQKKKKKKDPEKFDSFLIQLTNTFFFSFCNSINSYGNNNNFSLNILLMEHMEVRGCSKKKKKKEL